MKTSRNRRSTSRPPSTRGSLDPRQLAQIRGGTEQSAMQLEKIEIAMEKVERVMK